MATFNLIVEDSSPLITYSPPGAWVDTVNDSLIASYSGRSSHSTSAQGATATFTFNGTGVKLFGGRRPGYGTYTIFVDGQAVMNGDAESPSPATRQMLVSVSGLANGQHTVTLRCDGGGAVDIDWIEMENGLQMIPTAIDDTDSRIQYLPSASAWSTNSNPAFIGNTLHFTQTPGASASLSFTGDAVAVYGTVSPDHANVRVEVDGQGRIMNGGASGFASALHPAVLLYFMDNLGPGEHTLILSADVGEGTGPFLDIDSVTTFAIPPINNNGAPAIVSQEPFPNQSSIGTSVPETTEPLPTLNTAATTSPASSSMSKRALIGAIVGGILGFLLLLALIAFFLLRWRRRRHAAPRAIKHQSSLLSPVLPMQRTPVMLESGILSPVNRPMVSFGAIAMPRPPVVHQDMDRHSIAPSYYGAVVEEMPRAPSRASSSDSSTPILPPVPILSQPQPPKRKAPPPIDTQSAGPPMRPSKRPPTLQFP
ncbi:hypothetical protein AX16_005255 [Volvariella volvacea WC 439]|nr:hypothetical protein AX16_005255 [Volvariella volvacea WC 439]